MRFFETLDDAFKHHNVSLAGVPSAITWLQVVARTVRGQGVGKSLMYALHDVGRQYDHVTLYQELDSLQHASR